MSILVNTASVDYCLTRTMELIAEIHSPLITDETFKEKSARAIQLLALARMKRDVRSQLRPADSDHPHPSN